MSINVLLVIVVGMAVFTAIVVWVLHAENERHVRALVDGALERFQNVSNAALKANGEELRALNAGELAHLLDPLRKSIAESLEATRVSQEKTGLMEARFDAHMKALQGAAEKFDAGSTSFVNAITGANKVAGNWGERVLEQVLDDCQLVKGVHYVAQTGGVGSIPDFQVFDAAGKKILVIDSKVSWKKFKEMSESSDPVVREAALVEHVGSIRDQIDKLAGKRYHETLTPPAGKEGYQYLPFSAMFVPSDAALWEAIKRDPTIPAYAYGKGVALVTPTSVYGFMKLIHEGWAFYNAQKNQEKIAHEAELVVDRIDALFRALEEADVECGRMQAKIAAAKKLAAEGGSCIRGPANKILELHGKLKRPLKSDTMREAYAQAD